MVALAVGLTILDCTLKEKFCVAEYGHKPMESEEKARFDALIRKHGLQYDLAYIRDWPQDPWYIDKRGRRIKFR